jgi:hypothetical protein
MRSFLKVSAVLGAFLFCLGFTTIRATQEQNQVRNARGGAFCWVINKVNCTDRYNHNYDSSGRCRECHQTFPKQTTHKCLLRTPATNRVTASFMDSDPAAAGETGTTRREVVKIVVCVTKTLCEANCVVGGVPVSWHCQWGATQMYKQHADWKESEPQKDKKGNPIPQSCIGPTKPKG